MAAVAAAVLASQLGVYGTIAGAGVMSIVATCGGSVFQHFFRRTGEQIREVTVQVTHPEGRRVTVHTKETGPARRTGGAPRPEPGQADDATTMLPAADAERTRLIRSVADAYATPGPDPAHSGLTAPATDRTQALDLRDVRTRMLRIPKAAGPGADADRTRPLPGAGAGPGQVVTHTAFTGGVTHGTRLRGWKRPALAAGAVFAVAMASITAFEAVSDTQLGGGQGTTLSSVVRGGDADPAPATPDPAPSQDAGQDGGSGELEQTPEGGPGSAPATDPDGAATRDPAPDADGETPGVGPAPTPSHSGGGESAQATPDPTDAPTPDDGASAAPDDTAAPGGAPGPGDQAPLDSGAR
ncbi:hypothetical protein V9U70_18815 [Streptomyces pratensis]